MKLLNQTQEAVLRLFLDSYALDETEDLSLCIDYDKKPDWLQFLEIDKAKKRLEQEGVYLQSFVKTLGTGDLVYLTPHALTYFSDKEKYLSEQGNKATSGTTTINFNAPVFQTNTSEESLIINAPQHNNGDNVKSFGDNDTKAKKWNIGHTLTLIGIIVATLIGLLAWLLPRNTTMPLAPPATGLVLNSVDENISDEEQEMPSIAISDIPEVPYEEEQYNYPDNLEDIPISEGIRLAPVSGYVTLERGRAHTCEVTLLTFSPVRIFPSHILVSIAEHGNSPDERYMNSGYVFHYSFNEREFRLTIHAVNFISNYCIIVIHEILSD